MKRLFALAVSLLALNFNAYANSNPEENLAAIRIYDHSDGRNYQEASRLAYQLAELGERWAYRSYDYRLSGAANELHHASTDLYYALRNQNGRGFGLYEHSPGGFNPFDQMLTRVAYAVEQFSQVAPYNEAYRARSLFNSLRYNLGR